MAKGVGISRRESFLEAAQPKVTAITIVKQKMMFVRPVARADLAI